MKDLIVLVADKQMEFAIRGLLSRPEALSICNIDADVYVHPERDPGCRRDAHNFLRPYHTDYQHGLVLFDQHGCGAEDYVVDELEEEVRSQLSRNGWQNRADCVILIPELEIWVWSDSPHVDISLGWQEQNTTVREWLEQEGFWQVNESKPDYPKEALEIALRKVNRPRSASLFKRLARRVSVNRCTDPAFNRFRDLLQGWFPSEGH